jgi:hypothetical protein
MANQTQTTTTQYAVNRTAKLAYKRVGDGAWEPIDLKSVPANAGTRAGHAKIGEKWFTILTA